MTLLTEVMFDNLYHRGKVRNMFNIGDGLLIMIATDRISAFDHVVGAIPEKGKILNQLSAFWFGQTKHIIPNHLVGMAISHDFNRSILTKQELKDDFRSEIERRSMIVKKAERIDVECVVRGYITGSAWTEYRSSKTVFGQPMPAMVEGQPFRSPIFTPTTKAEVGHDESLSSLQLEEMVGKEIAALLKQKSIELYTYARDFAHDRGVIIADTKFEFGWIDNQLTLIDELFTPDSSRFWDLSDYRSGRLMSFDKQFVRDWLNEQGWNHEPPAPKLPNEVVQKTRERYIEAFRRLTGREFV